MTSAIVSSTINENFPVAGEDNNSVGFRNNFSYIKTGLATAAGEITALQATTAKTNADNDFNGVKIENAETNLLYGTIYTGNASSDLTIDALQGEYFSHGFTGADTTRLITFLRTWPAGGYSKIRVDLTDGDPTTPGSGIARTITFAASGGTVFIDGDLTYPFVTAGDETLHYIFEVWTIDGGDTIFIKSLGTFEAI